MGLAITCLYTSFSLFYGFAEYTKRKLSFLTLSVTRLICWLLLIVGIEVLATPSWYSSIIQLSFAFNILAESCNLIRNTDYKTTAIFYSFSFASGCRTVALWTMIATDPTNRVELSIPAFVGSIAILAWFYLYPTFKARHKALKLYTFTFFLQAWAIIDLILHHSSHQYSILLIATAGYLVTFAKYYMQSFVVKQTQVNVHWSYFIANAMMALSTGLHSPLG